MQIVLASDQKYFDGLIVTILSVLASNQGEGRRIRFHVVDGGIQEKSWQLLLQKSKSFRVDASFEKHTIDEDAFSHLTTLHGSRLTYARLLVGSLVLVDKIIFMDCDMFCKTDLFSVWDDFSLSGRHIVAGCVDPIIRSLHNDSQALGRELEDGPYINAGFLLINLAKWREFEVERKCLDLLSSQGHLCNYHDQSALNFILHGHIHILDPSFNTVTYPPLREKPERAVIHYIGKCKPWTYYSHNPNFVDWRAFYKTNIARRGAYLYSRSFLYSFVRQKIKFLLNRK